MGGGTARPWTPADVLSELVRAFGTMPALYSPRRSEFLSVAGDEDACSFDLVALTESWLGRNSPERIALVTRARALGRPAAHTPIREICRDRTGWSGSRSAFYRMSNRGARLMAGMLNAKEIPAPRDIPKPRRWRKYSKSAPRIL